MNEPTHSAATAAAIERVGGVLGARGGTGPDDDPFLRSQRRKAYAEGLREGLKEGRRAAMVLQILRARGIPVPDRFPADTAALAA